MAGNLAGKGLRRYAWGVLGWNLAVIVWGAYVRASGSGSGCGGNWPNCNGQWVIAGPMPFRMFVEYSHRLSTVVATGLVLGLVWLTHRALPRGHGARRAALSALAFLLFEAILGALLVFHPASVAVLGLHQVNTLFLVAALALTALWCGPRAAATVAPPRSRYWKLVAGGALLLLTAVFGVIAALADTLARPATLAAGFAQDTQGDALTRLRLAHPALAVMAGMYLLYLVASGLSESRFGKVLAGAVLVQWCVGGLDVLLLTPVWVQLTHLLTADLVWIAFVFYAEGQLLGVAGGVPAGRGATAPAPETTTVRRARRA